MSAERLVGRPAYLGRPCKARSIARNRSHQNHLQTDAVGVLIGTNAGRRCLIRPTCITLHRVAGISRLDGLVLPSRLVFIHLGAAGPEYVNTRRLSLLTASTARRAQCRSRDTPRPSRQHRGGDDFVRPDVRASAQTHFATGGLQFWSNVIGVVSARTVSIRNRPSRATSY
jgi:hypothetical protein